MQRADLFQPIEALNAGQAPLIIRTVVTPEAAMVVGGVPSKIKKIEDYVKISALPDELKQRVHMIVQALIQGG